MGKQKLLPGLELGRTTGPGEDGEVVRLGADRGEESAWQSDQGCRDMETGQRENQVR